MTRSPRDRPSAAEKKERQGRTGPVDCGMAVPATSADLVNLPQDFSLGSRGNGRRCSVLKILKSGPLSSSAPDCLSSSLKEFRVPHGAVVLSSQLAILAEGRAGTKDFNVRASLFVGPRLSVVFPQGVQGAPWRRRAQLPASDPCGRTCRNFATRRTTSSRVPSRPDAGPMAPWQEIPQMLPPSVPLGFQGSQPPPR